jgi:hypothetical protein
MDDLAHLDLDDFGEAEEILVRVNAIRIANRSSCRCGGHAISSAWICNLSSSNLQTASSGDIGLNSIISVEVLPSGFDHQGRRR